MTHDENLSHKCEIKTKLDWPEKKSLLAISLIASKFSDIFQKRQIPWQIPGFTDQTATMI